MCNAAASKSLVASAAQTHESMPPLRRTTARDEEEIAIFLKSEVRSQNAEVKLVFNPHSEIFNLKSCFCILTS
jgi:hypothetical protein